MAASKMASFLLVLLSILVAKISAEKHLILVSLSADPYYKNHVEDIAKFASDLAGNFVYKLLLLLIPVFTAS